MGLPPRPLIPLIVDPTEWMKDYNESATTASPRIQCQVQRAHLRQDGTQSTSSGAYREEDDVAMLHNGGDTRPPTKLPTGNGLVALQFADCCAPQTQSRTTSERNSDASINATTLMDNIPPPGICSKRCPF
jgi:hypothetical protein